MRTYKSETVALIANRIAVLGLKGFDTYRLARRLVEGKDPCNIEEFAFVLHNSCRDTIRGGHNYLLRSAGEDLVIYGPKGFVVYNHVEGVLEGARAYTKGESFESMTALYRDEPLEIEPDEQEELSCYDDNDPTYYYLSYLAAESAAAE